LATIKQPDPGGAMTIELRGPARASAIHSSRLLRTPSLTPDRQTAQSHRSRVRRLSESAICWPAAWPKPQPANPQTGKSAAAGGDHPRSAVLSCRTQVPGELPVNCYPPFPPGFRPAAPRGSLVAWSHRSSSTKSI
jgi:hypothetical protein